MCHMKRRGFIALIGGAAAWPLAARAQQPAMPVVGFLSSASPEAFAPYLDAFRLGLEQAGFVEGRNFTIVYCWARGRDGRLPALAAELVERKVAVIAASGEPAVMAAKAATATTPIIFLLDGDPVRLGLVAGFHRPGGNLSGVTVLTLALDLQRLALLREALPKVARMAVLINPNFPGSLARGAGRRPQHGARSRRRAGLQRRRHRPGVCQVRAAAAGCARRRQRSVPRFPARPDRRARRALWRPGDVRTARLRRSGRLDELWHASSRLVSQAGRVYRARSQGDERRRSAGAAADAVRTRHQP